MNRFLHIIVNQQSRNSIKKFKELVLELPKYTNHYQVHQTNSIQQLDRLLSQLKDKISPKDIIVFVGGDGSLNQGVTLMEKYQMEHTVGYLATGSGNDFARAMGLSTNISEALDHFISHAKEKELAILQATEGDKVYYAVNSLGIGIDGYVNHLIRDQKQNKSGNFFPYLRMLFKAFTSQQKFPVTLKVDDGIFHFEKVQIALFVNNPYFGGGLHIIPGASNQDDEIEVLIGHNVSYKDLLNIIGRLLTGKSHLEHPKLVVYKTKRASLFTEASDYGQKDGEVFHQNGYALTVSTKNRKFWL